MFCCRIVTLILIFEFIRCLKIKDDYRSKPKIREPVLDYGEDEDLLDIANKLLGDILNPEENDQNKIVGGTPTQVTRWPWIAGIMRKGKATPFCGGSLINENTIVTAGHCVSRENPNSLKVVVGTSHMGSRGRETSAQSYDVRSLRVHPRYKFPLNDIAIIKLKSDVDLNDKVKPIDLDDGQALGTGRSASVAGWGTTRYGGQMSRKLRDVNLKLWDTNSCRKAIRDFQITTGMVCAGDPNGRSKDACQGDSGGPLMSRAGGQWKLIGVVSFGDKCGKPNTPGVYTRVNKYRNWVLQQAKL